MFKQEEFKSISLPKEAEEKLELQSRRYVVGWEICKTNADRTIVFVFDKLSQRIVYKVNTKERKGTYPYIQKQYGMNNCVPPRELRLDMYEKTT